MNVRRAARYLDVSVSYLNRLRSVGGGPIYAKFGRRVTYDQDDLDEYAQQRKQRSTSDNDGSF